MLELFPGPTSLSEPFLNLSGQLSSSHRCHTSVVHHIKYQHHPLFGHRWLDTGAALR